MRKHDIQFTSIDVIGFCKERIFEIFSIELNSKLGGGGGGGKMFSKILKTSKKRNIN
jgi:hypothetical protein